MEQTKSYPYSVNGLIKYILVLKRHDIHSWKDKKEAEIFAKGKKPIRKGLLLYNFNNLAFGKVNSMKRIKSLVVARVEKMERRTKL